MAQYPNYIYQRIIISIILYKAKIEYYRFKQKIINTNLPSATNDLDILMTDLKKKIVVNQLTKITNVKNYSICFLLGLVPKFNKKWYKIHHLSYLYRY